MEAMFFFLKIIIIKNLIFFSLPDDAVDRVSAKGRSDVGARPDTSNANRRGQKRNLAAAAEL
jgi:hypothetical protein